MTFQPPRPGTHRPYHDGARSDDLDRRVAERFAPRRTAPDGPRFQPDRRRERSRRSWWRSPLGVVAGVVGACASLIVAAGAIVLALGPSDLIRDRLVAEVKARSGRDLLIRGGTAFTLYPSVGVTLGDVSLSAPPGMKAPPTVVTKALDVSVAVLPLFQSRIVVERLVLRQPVIDLRVDANGRRSWQFADAADAPSTSAGGPIRIAQAGKAEPIPAELDAFIKGSTQKPGVPSKPATPASSPTAVLALDQISLGDVRIEGGTVTYVDQRSGVSEQVTRLNAVISAKSLAQPARLDGDAIVRGERLDFGIKVASPERLIQGAAVKVALDVKGRPGATSFDGSITLAKGLDGDGDLRIDVPALPGLLRLAGLELPAGTDVGGLEIAGRLRTTDSSVTLADATIRVDRTDLAGNVALDVAGTRPLIRATLTSPAIDVDRIEALVATLGAARLTAPKTPPPAATSPPAARGAPKSIADLLAETGAGTPPAPGAPPTGARVKGSTQRGGWSEQPFDLTALGLVDVDARLTLGRLQRRSFRAGRTQASLALKARTLRLVVDDMQVYDGRGRGIVSLDATTAVAGLGANVTAEGVSVTPLLESLELRAGLAGRGKLSLAVAGRGGSERQLVETLSGKADLSVGDGALIGYNIPQIIRAIGQLKFTGIERTETEKTDFSELAASFTISNGVARTEDIRLASPLLRLTGAGDVTLPERTLDLRLRPKLVGTLAGQGGESALTGIELPVRLVGPWDRPRVEPDQAALSQILKDPGKAVDAVKELGRQFKGKNADEIVRGVLGGGTPGDPGQVNPGKLLEKLFKP